MVEYNHNIYIIFYNDTMNLFQSLDNLTLSRIKSEVFIIFQSMLNDFPC